MSTAPHKEKKRVSTSGLHENIARRQGTGRPARDLITRQAAFAGSSSRPPDTYARKKRSRARLTGGRTATAAAHPYFGVPLLPHTVPPDQTTKLGYRGRVLLNTSSSAAPGCSLFPLSMTSFDVLRMLARYWFLCCRLVGRFDRQCCQQHRWESLSCSVGLRSSFQQPPQPSDGGIRWNLSIGCDNITYVPTPGSQ
jgi:hypothetical protein